MSNDELKALRDKLMKVTQDTPRYEYDELADQVDWMSENDHFTRDILLTIRMKIRVGCMTLAIEIIDLLLDYRKHLTALNEVVA